MEQLVIYSHRNLSDAECHCVDLINFPLNILYVTGE